MIRFPRYTDVLRHSTAILFRLAAVTIATAFGWCCQMLMYLLVAPGASSGDISFWATYSAVYCLVAVIAVGGPVACLQPTKLTRHPLGSSMKAGIAGAAIALLPPAGGMFVLTVPLGFLAGLFAMWVYLAAAHLFPNAMGDEAD